MALALNELQLFQMLREKMGEKEAEALVTFVDAKVKESVKENNEQNLKVVSTKEDIANTNEKISNLRGELKTEIATSKVDMIKGMVGFWIVQMAAIIGLYMKK